MGRTSELALNQQIQQQRQTTRPVMVVAWVNVCASPGSMDIRGRPSKSMRKPQSKTSNMTCFQSMMCFSHSLISNRLNNGFALLPKIHFVCFVTHNGGFALFSLFWKKPDNGFALCPKMHFVCFVMHNGGFALCPSHHARFARMHLAVNFFSFCKQKRHQPRLFFYLVETYSFRCWACCYTWFSCSVSRIDKYEGFHATSCCFVWSRFMRPGDGLTLMRTEDISHCQKKQRAREQLQQKNKLTTPDKQTSTQANKQARKENKHTEKMQATIAECAMQTRGSSIDRDRWSESLCGL